MSVRRATEALFRKQQPDGYWWAELQSNPSITAEVLLLHHVWGNFDRVPKKQAEAYFRREQCAHGGWELAYGDGGELSVSRSDIFGGKVIPFVPLSGGHQSEG